jgi:SAM-dependent methyltransferase
MGRSGVLPKTTEGCIGDGALNDLCVMTGTASAAKPPDMTGSNLDHVAACWEGNAEIWTRQSRAGYDVYRDQNNTPAFLATLPPIAGLEGIDLGCGEGSNTRLLAARGARMHAVDIAPTFIKHAQSAGGGITYQVASGTQLPYPDASFDFATAFMSLMDMPDHELALREALRVLRPRRLSAIFYSAPMLLPTNPSQHQKLRRHCRCRARGGLLRQQRRPR